MRYLRETGRSAPAIELKAKEYLNLGFQRLLTFEARTGGFNWWASEETGNVVLTALGVQQFEDLAKVQGIDRAIIDRCTAWLKTKQNADGSWEPDAHLHGDNAALGGSKLRTTAYILWSLLEAGQRDAAVERAAQFVTTHYREAGDDAYTLALAANALTIWKADDGTTRDVLAELLKRKVEDRAQKTVCWKTTTPTACYSSGDGAAVEATALAAQALIRSGRSAGDANGALAWLVKAKAANATWGSTQATVLALKALLAGMRGQGGDADMSVDVTVDGKKVANEAFTPQNSDVLRLIDAGVVKPGRHEVRLAPTGPGNVMYQVVGRWYRPWAEAGGAREPLTIKVEYDRARLKVDDVLTAKVRVDYHLDRPTFMVLVDLGIPPGFSVAGEDLEALVKAGTIKRYSLTGRQVIVYLGDVSKDKPILLSYKLKARFPVRAKTPRSVAYEYYTPTSRGVQEPELLTVEGK